MTVESPVRADPPPEAAPEAVPTHRRRGRPGEAAGITVSGKPLGAKQARRSLHGAVTQDMIDRLRPRRRHEVLRHAVASLAALAPQVSVKVTSHRRVVAPGRGRRRAEGPFAVRAAWRGVLAAAADGAAWGDAWDHAAGCGALAGILKARTRANCIADGQGQELSDAWPGEHAVDRGARRNRPQALGRKGGELRRI